MTLVFGQSVTLCHSAPKSIVLQCEHAINLDTFVLTRKIDNFTFKNQTHYDKLGDIMAPTIADQVQETFGLERLMLPLEKHRGDCPVTFPILYSKDIWTNPKLVVIVLGAGKVELCIWSRSLCINKSLGKGSVMQAVHQAMVVRGCAVLLTNPNINVYSDPANRSLKRIPGNGSPEDHLHYLYRLFIERSAAKEIAIIAHSFGGVATMSLLSHPDIRDDLLGKGRLKSVTLTDSVHSSGMTLYSIDKATKKWLAENAINWIRSNDPLGTEYTLQSLTQRQSAGTTDHASTNYTTVKVLWDWIDARMTREPLNADASPSDDPTPESAFDAITADLASLDLVYKDKRNGARDAKTPKATSASKPKKTPSEKPKVPKDTPKQEEDAPQPTGDAKPQDEDSSVSIPKDSPVADDDSKDSLKSSDDDTSSKSVLKSSSSVSIPPEPHVQE